jgi:prepilin-type N-terminal cleavage/methylation domain-containing protein
LSTVRVRGFTVIEILVVTFIIGILSTVMFANYRQGEQVLAEQQSLQTVVQAIRAAQSKALGAEAITCDDPPCKYGVDIDKLAHPTTLIVFADGTAGPASNNGNYDIGEEIEIFELEKGIEVISVFPGPDKARIFFEPPDPVITFEPPPPGARTIMITGGRTVTASKGGSVDVN